MKIQKCISRKAKSTIKPTERPKMTVKLSLSALNLFFKRVSLQLRTLDV